MAQQFTNDEKFGFFLDLWENTTEGASTFYEALVAFTRGHVERNKAGLPIGSTTDAGKSFSRDSYSKLTPLALQALGAEGIRRYKAAQAVVGNDEQAIWDAMQTDLLSPGVTEYRSDFSSYGIYSAS